MALPDTTIVRDLTPTARVFGIEFQDLIFILVLYLPIAFVVWVVFPPLNLSLDVIDMLGGRPSPEPLSLNLVPWVPSLVLWVLISLVYLQVRKDKPRGYLQDIGVSITDGLEKVTGSPDPHYWEGGHPDTRIDRYWYDD